MSSPQEKAMRRRRFTQKAKVARRPAYHARRRRRYDRVERRSRLEYQVFQR
jgi:hypothetical protein